jgi:hypothetical protein
VSNRRKPRASRPRLPRCADCHSTTYTGTIGTHPLIHIDHDPHCPAFAGLTPSTVQAWVTAEASAGRTVIYWRRP